MASCYFSVKLSHRQHKFEGRSFAEAFRAARNCSSSRLNYLLNNGQAQTNPFTVDSGSALKLSKPREKLIHVASCDTTAIVADFDLKLRVERHIVKLGPNVDLASSRILNSILD